MTYAPRVNGKLGRFLPLILMAVFVVTRWPGLMPPSFSAAYALAFCAGVYWGPRLAWSLPLATFVLSDVLLNLFYYRVAPISGYTFVNYVGYAALIAWGRHSSPRSRWWILTGRGLLGAMFFYLVTNTAAWIHNPAYVKALTGWFQSLTVGTAGWPPTWEFFRNTLLSGGLFTALFVGAAKASEAMESETEEELEPASGSSAGEPAESEA
jgi:hypothetical protein